MAEAEVELEADFGMTIKFVRSGDTMKVLTRDTRTGEQWRVSTSIFNAYKLRKFLEDNYQ